MRGKGLELRRPRPPRARKASPAGGRYGRGGQRERGAPRRPRRLAQRVQQLERARCQRWCGGGARSTSPPPTTCTGEYERTTKRSRHATGSGSSSDLRVGALADAERRPSVYEQHASVTWRVPCATHARAADERFALAWHAEERKVGVKRSVLRRTGRGQEIARRTSSVDTAFRLRATRCPAPARSTGSPCARRCARVRRPRATPPRRPSADPPTGCP
ncbi:MAG: hypothetical protein ACLSVD_07360 [Eggerthellaceae bacterium]